MTIPYGVTTTGIKEQLQSEYFTLLDPAKGKNKLFELYNHKFNKKDTTLYLKNKEMAKLALIIYS